jgi:hypothetical protein
MKSPFWAPLLALPVVVLLANTPAEAVLPSGNFVGPVQITVNVDPTVCRTGAVQCSGTGGTIPANGNRVPIAVRFQALTNSGAPITTLTQANVTLVTGLVPAGGTLLSIRSCASCFQNVGNGVYGFWIEPFGSFNWKSGNYTVQVQVTSGTFTARALTEVPIPF